MYVTAPSLYLVFGWMPTDLRQHLRHATFAGAQLQSLLRQLLAAIAHTHARRFLHRNLKPAHVLVGPGPDPQIKVAGWDSAREFQVPLAPLTHDVVTLWYRAPELLLGQELYSTPIDVWSIGCIFAEMATGEALFQGDSQIGTLMKIFEVLGTPSVRAWPGLLELPDFKLTFPKWPCSNWRCLRTAQLHDEAHSLLAALLRYDPVQRIACAEALEHPFFEDAAAPE